MPQTRHLRRILIIAVAIGLVGLIAWGFMPRPVGVDVREVARGKLSVTVTEEGRTRVIDRYLVSAPIDGYARRIELDVGDAVVAGQELVHLDPLRSGTLDPRSQAEAQAGVYAAQAALSAANEAAGAITAEAERARNEYERLRRLAAQGLVSQNALDAARAEWRSSGARQRSAEFNVDVAEGKLEVARAALDYAAATPSDADAHQSVVVTAPVDGRVLKIIRESEGAVLRGQELIEIGDPTALEIEVELLSQDAVRLRPGMPVRLLRWGGPVVLQAAVRRIEPTGFTKFSALGVEEQRVLVICDITSPLDEWQALGDGYRVEAEFVIWEEDDVLQIPTSALIRRGADWAVFVVDEGRARVDTVTLGQQSGLAAQVLEGLPEGQLVIIYPGERVSEGARVRPR
jgi:HlyD family secretion protein